ncbi:hypothetical protein HYS31_03700 [Candidatus Woesearchaeota archaeon]|nr:hypothetical protein [Candidatus Woesearchaeota archaeon]
MSEKLSEKFLLEGVYRLNWQIMLPCPKNTKLAEFLLYDMFSKIGEKIPILGGQNTRLHHFFNHIPDLIVRNRKSLDEMVYA